ncbi:hypothetical protein RCL1_008844 [Eukaryota sp. TZLM3-RCL]
MSTLYPFQYIETTSFATVTPNHGFHTNHVQILQYPSPPFSSPPPSPPTSSGSFLSSLFSCFSVSSVSEECCQVLDCESQRDSPQLYPLQLPLLGPQAPHHIGRRTLVLDLDETLIHTSFQCDSTCDFVVSIPVYNTMRDCYVHKRPHVDKFLYELSQFFEIVLFTASLPSYANPLIDIIDRHRVISYRLFRESCVFMNNAYVKDLSLLGRDLNHVVIVDNCPNAYQLQKSLGIPIPSWFTNKLDCALVQLIPVLTELSQCHCIVEFISCREWTEIFEDRASKRSRNRTKPCRQLLRLKQCLCRKRCRCPDPTLTAPLFA